jgi:hypothetical protein
VDRHRGPAGAKTEALDADLLARPGRRDRAALRRLVPDSPLSAERKGLTRAQDTLIPGQTRLLHHLTACRKASYPVALELCGTLHQPTTRAFVQPFPPLEQARAARGAQRSAGLQAAGHPQAAANAAPIWQQVPQPQLQAAPVLTRATARLLLALVAHLQPLRAPSAA